ncbi:Mediator of RNA polymerase II transcription subunit 7 [Penicillium subrubescens]|uniref:Mediator of RNA polymerase II transcription subunit 7 n=1 Tax=Penicillium subrubescens TaxID=1316194 RepID=A0A1Q5UMP5_9EURO|nr:Mediator of RNA polymerase II transcription subunit 7 [Penicillium subrubescens]KAJ5912213.1 Mediator of RNA polymerase II transcription subunit 7 [Penicillium subrubescens]OKP13766.1 Mediator of RNA polymerase II transcription subunit 7 [Penicillium subrubescens]
MADTNEQRAVATAFAPPPPLWKHFTRDNLDKLDQIKTEASKDKDGIPAVEKKWSPAELRALEVPSELRFLVPPEIPTGEYTVFGEPQTLSTTLPSLKDQGIEQLYPEPASDADQALSQPAQHLNHAYYLLKISKSLLLNFLEFVGILSVSPEQFESKVEDLRNLFINAHHLLNLYRPHQARESLIMMMEEQLKRTREEIKQMDKVKADIESLMEQLEAEGGAVNSAERIESTDTSKVAAKRSVEDAQLIWDLLDKVN